MMLSKYYLTVLSIVFSVSGDEISSEGVKLTRINTDGDTRDIFSSTYQMQLLLKAEIEFVNYIQNNKDILNNSTKYVFTIFCQVFLFLNHSSLDILFLLKVLEC